ncbi:MAG: methylenetetrahydrofolate reductase C-terminal domain-containing protein, partial [Rhodobiaceae bacterium]|nr:methylenetetrahydrofolate reductase C-terminal domain-containing protein [Rhodobiaceae bacterium]
MLKKRAPDTAYKPSGVSGVGRARARYSIRLWSVRNARFFEWFYAQFADTLLKLHWFWKAVGYGRAERPVKAVEKVAKRFLFDCRMCGQCALSSTGMSCPMNCPKGLRNGPCGGVRANGHCEVEPDMPCVWVQAWQGSRQMRKGDAILAVQKP